MEQMLEALERQRAERLVALLAASAVDAQRVDALKRVMEDLELVAAAVTPANAASSGCNPNPDVLTADFYAGYLLVVLLSKNLNDARFLWKRIDAETKGSSEQLGAIWEIGKALWQRNLAGAYAAMSKPWPAPLQPLVNLLRRSTRESTAELLSIAYSTIAFEDVMQALGFDQEGDMTQYCASLSWDVSAADKMIHPKPLRHARERLAGIQQLDSLSASVLHLEQNTVVKLP